MDAKADLIEWLSIARVRYDYENYVPYEHRLLLADVAGASGIQNAGWIQRLRDGTSQVVLSADGATRCLAYLESQPPAVAQPDPDYLLPPTFTFTVGARVLARAKRRPKFQDLWAAPGTPPQVKVPKWWVREG